MAGDEPQDSSGTVTSAANSGTRGLKTLIRTMLFDVRIHRMRDKCSEFQEHKSETEYDQLQRHQLVQAFKAGGLDLFRKTDNSQEQRKWRVVVQQQCSTWQCWR